MSKKKTEKEEIIVEEKQGLSKKELYDLNNLVVFYKNDFMEVNYKRVKLDIKATELYPED